MYRLHSLRVVLRTKQSLTIKNGEGEKEMWRNRGDYCYSMMVGICSVWTVASFSSLHHKVVIWPHDWRFAVAGGVLTGAATYAIGLEKLRSFAIDARDY